jgi:hypothetical protein
MTPEIKKALDLALEALEPFSTPNWAGTGVDKVNAAITAIRQVRSAPVQEPAKRVCSLGCKNLGACCADPMCEAVAAIPPAQPAPVSNETMQKLREKLESPSYNHALAYQNIREALEIVMRWIDDYCETGPENDFERVEKIANAAMEYTPPAAREWVGLTDEDKLTVRRMPWETLGDLMDNTEAKLKEKNNGGPQLRESP